MPLDARELSQRVKTLTSSLSKNDPPADIIAQLDLLKKEPAPTEEILRVSIPTSCPTVPYKRLHFLAQMGKPPFRIQC